MSLSKYNIHECSTTTTEGVVETSAFSKVLKENVTSSQDALVATTAEVLEENITPPQDALVATIAELRAENERFAADIAELHVENSKLKEDNLNLTKRVESIETTLNKVREALQ